MNYESSLYNYWTKFLEPIRTKRDALSEKVIKKGIFAKQSDKLELKILTKIYDEKIVWLEKMLEEE